MEILTHPVLSTLSAQAMAPDTVVMVVARDALQTAASWATVVIGLSFFVIVPGLLHVLRESRKVNRTFRALSEAGLRQADPLLARGKEIADNVAFVSAAVRTDVEHLTTSVRALSDRLQQASDHMEERIGEFNILMEVVQSEAEDIFIGAASTIRGVRVGTRTLRSGPGTQIPDEKEPGRPEENGAEHPDSLHFAPRMTTPPQD